MLFVCVKNAGKSQMAAALARQRYGQSIRVRSAGTRPGRHLNEESVNALEEVEADTADEHPKPLDPRMLAEADLVIILGSEAQVDTGTTPTQRWITDEPSTRGIHGKQRMRLVRDDISTHITHLAEHPSLNHQPGTPARGMSKPLP